MQRILVGFEKYFGALGPWLFKDERDSYSYAIGELRQMILYGWTDKVVRPIEKSN